MQRSPYIRFSREAWSDLRADTPLTLTEEDLEDLQGINVSLSLEEVADVHLPPSPRATARIRDACHGMTRHSPFHP